MAESNGTVFPGMPSTTAKAVTSVLLGGCAVLAGVGAWYAKEVEVDPGTAAVIAERVNVPGLVTIGGSVIMGMVGLFQKKQQSDQAHAAVKAAAAAPPTDANGFQNHVVTLNAALTQASRDEAFDDAQEILNLVKKMKTAPTGLPKLPTE